MKRSLSSYIVLLVLKIKGIKKSFSQNPIDYLSIRKNDICVPKSNFFSSAITKTFTVKETKITEIVKDINSTKLILYVHGGAFISGPNQHHWNTIEKISKETNHTVWMCDYPKAPEHKITQISNNIDSDYELASKKYNRDSIILIGDSAGGTLVISLIQRLIKNEVCLPLKIILISPVLDASFDNPKIKDLDKKDPMLTKMGVLSAKQMCAEDNNLNDIRLSPINGSFKGFPNTYLFIAENDITSPDQIIMFEKLKQLKVKHKVFFGNGMPHIWPLLPIMKESKIAFNRIIQILNE